jgi:hypothetical protein
MEEMINQALLTRKMKVSKKTSQRKEVIAFAKSTIHAKADNKMLEVLESVSHCWSLQHLKEKKPNKHPQSMYAMYRYSVYIYG